MFQSLQETKAEIFCKKFNLLLRKRHGSTIGPPIRLKPRELEELYKEGERLQSEYSSNEKIKEAVDFLKEITKAAKKLNQ